MARKTKNKFEESTLAFEKNTEFRIFDIELPFSVNITFQPILDGHLCPGITSQDVYLPISEKAEIEQKLKKLGHKVIEIKPSIARVIDQCQRCKRKGIPKIERKDTSDKRERTWRNKDEQPRVKRPDEYWFTYDHKTKPLKCRIMRFVSPFRSPEVKLNKKKEIKLDEFIFPYAIGYLKRKSMDSRQKTYVTTS